MDGHSSFYSVSHHQLQRIRQVLEVLYRLRKECPWDAKQTWASLRPYTIEEVYELAEALSVGDVESVKEELGDVWMHIILYARIAEEKQWFDLGDVLDALREKLIRRHPHIFGQETAQDADEVARNWEVIKRQEKKKSSHLSGVPKHLPALIKAYRLQEKAAGVGFDWSSAGPVIEKIEEELAELKKAMQQSDLGRIEEEIGDLLFATINLARKLGVEPEGALEQTNRKFQERFEYIERQATRHGVALEDLSLEEMDKWWEDAKASGST